MNKYSVMPTFKYSDDDMIDIISSAIYDIDYWACIDNDTDEWDKARKELPDGTFEDRMYHILKYDYIVRIFDAEYTGEVWNMTLNKLLNGIKLTIENGYWNGKIDDIDGEVGDIIFQYALFEDIIYG